MGDDPVDGVLVPGRLNVFIAEEVGPEIPPPHPASTNNLDEGPEIPPTPPAFIDGPLKESPA